VVGFGFKVHPDGLFLADAHNAHRDVWIRVARLGIALHLEFAMLAVGVVDGKAGTGPSSKRM